MDEKELLLTLVQEIKSMRTEMDEKFSSIDKRLDGVDKRLDGMDKRLDGMDKRLDTIDERLDGIEEDTQVTRSAVNSLIEWADQVAVISQVKFPIQKAK